MFISYLWFFTFCPAKCRVNIWIKDKTFVCISCELVRLLFSTGPCLQQYILLQHIVSSSFCYFPNQGRLILSFVCYAYNVKNDELRKFELINFVEEYFQIPISQKFNSTNILIRHINIINRPCVAGPVLQTPLWLIKLVTDALWKYL